MGLPALATPGRNPAEAHTPSSVLASTLLLWPKAVHQQEGRPEYDEDAIHKKFKAVGHHQSLIMLLMDYGTFRRNCAYFLDPCLPKIRIDSNAVLAQLRMKCPH